MTIGFVLHGIPYQGRSGGQVITWALLLFLLKKGHKIRLCMMLPEYDKVHSKHIELLKTMCDDLTLLSFPRYRDRFKKAPFFKKIKMIFEYLTDPHQFYPEFFLKEKIVHFLEEKKNDALYIFDTGPMLALADYNCTPKMAVPGDPLFQVLKYRFGALPWKEKLNMKFFLQAIQYMFIRRRLERLVIDSAAKYEWIGMFGAQHANWLNHSGVPCESLSIPVEDLCKKKNYSFLQTEKRTNLPIRILIFGRQDTTAGQNGLKLFINDVLPALQNNIAQKICEIHIAGAGAVPQYFKKKLEESRCLMDGEVYDIEDEFTKSDIFLELSPYPVGMRTRVVTALSFGICVVANATSKAGLDSLVDGDNCLLGDDGKQLVNHLITCIHDAQLRKKLGMNARKTYEELFVPEKACAIIEKAIGNIGGSRMSV